MYGVARAAHWSTCTPTPFEAIPSPASILKSAAHTYGAVALHPPTSSLQGPDSCQPRILLLSPFLLPRLAVRSFALPLPPTAPAPDLDNGRPPPVQCTAPRLKQVVTPTLRTAPALSLDSLSSVKRRHLDAVCAAADPVVPLFELSRLARCASPAGPLVPPASALCCAWRFPLLQVTPSSEFDHRCN